MANPGIDNYDFPEKKRWRKDVWREIARRTNNKRKKLVLYLAGEQDLDREQAIKHGFSPWNMIAVEVNSDRCAALRAKGVTTIQGDLGDVLYNWPSKHQVGVVVADFCFGFEVGALDVFDSLQCDALRRACVLVNFQRGRDPASNFARKRLTESGFIKACVEAFYPGVSNKHRALHYLAFHAMETVSVLRRGPAPKDFVDFGVLREPSATVMMGCVMKGMRATLRTYKSGKALRMDSAVFNHPLALSPANIGDLVSRRSPPNNKMKRRITAALAVRTARHRAATAA